jgi:hypothetical protein
VPFVPQPNRTLIEFGHANSVVRGATGVAIEMQSDPRIIPVGVSRQPQCPGERLDHRHREYRRRDRPPQAPVNSLIARIKLPATRK